MRLIRRLRSRKFELSLIALWLMAAFNIYVFLSYSPDARSIPYVSGLDENCYYAYARSLFFDGDINFRNDFGYVLETQDRVLVEALAPYVIESPAQPKNTYPAGTGLAGLPGIAVAHGVAYAVSTFRGAPLLSGYSPLYVYSYYLTHVSYGVAALYLVFRLIVRWFSRSVAAFAVWAVFLTGPWLYYLFFGPGMSHLAGAFFGTLVIACCLRWRIPEQKGGALIAAFAGLAFGFSCSIRPYNAPLAVFLAEPLAAVLLRKWRYRQTPVAPILIRSIIAAIGVIAGFLPQLLIWKLQSGHWIANQQGHHFQLIPPYFFHVLFARRHGLFFWAPAYLVAFAGLLLALRRKRNIGDNPQPTPSLAYFTSMLLLVFLGVTWMYGNWHVWWLGFSFGMRGYIDLVYVFALGFAVVASAAIAALPGRGLRVAWLALVFFTIINFHLMTAFRAGAVYLDGPLYWLDSISRGKLYKQRLKWDAQTYTDWHPPRRVSLLKTSAPMPQ